MSTNPFATPNPDGPGAPAPQGAGAPGQPPHGPGTMTPGRQGMDSPAPEHGARLPQRLGDEGRESPIGFGRLFTVELRKMLDTRSGKWLFGVMIGLMVLIMALMSLVQSIQQEPNQDAFLQSASLALKFLLPIIGIMAVTTEWSQRTGLVTFTLEPRRPRVGFAKLVAALAISLVVLVATLLLSAAFGLLNAWLHGSHMEWSSGRNMLIFVGSFLVITAMGMAFGMLLQNTPAAICTFLFLPIVYSIITSMTETLRHVQEWTDPNYSLFILMGDDTPSQGWAKAAVSVFIWLIIPLVAGMWRLTHREVKSA